MHRFLALISATALLVVAATLLAGCGIGSGTPESKISETTDTYLRSLASGDSTKACAQLTAKAKRELGHSLCGRTDDGRCASRPRPARGSR